MPAKKDRIKLGLRPSSKKKDEQAAMELVEKIVETEGELSRNPKLRKKTTKTYRKKKLPRLP
jgi:hypothetical protein